MSNCGYPAQSAASLAGILLETGAHGPAEEISRVRLAQLAGLAGDAFAEAGVARGDRIVTMLPTCRALLQSIFGAWHIGGVICCVAPSAERGRSSLSMERLSAMLGLITPKVIILPASEHERMAPLAMRLGARLIRAETLPSDGCPMRPTVEAKPDEIAFVQFSSGSTGLPKAIAIEHGQLIENCRLIAAQGEMCPSDCVVSWLPLHHDFGFVCSLMTSFLAGVRLVLMPTETMMRGPHSWMETVSKHRATHTAAPPSSFQIISKAAYLRRSVGLDLSNLRVAFLGAEPIGWSVVKAFEEAYAHHGLAPGTLIPAYGMAEAVLAIASCRRGGPRRLAWVHRESFHRTGVVNHVEPGSTNGMALLSNGPLLPGFAARIVDPDSQALGEGQQGRILLSGPCITKRYFGSDENPQPDGWLDTGDLGFIWQNEIFVTGRAKDVIIRGGANVHAHEIEQAVLAAHGRTIRRAVAFSVPRPEDLRDEVVVAVEVSSATGSSLDADVRRTVLEHVGIPIDHIIAVPKGSIPHTTSGKVQRSLARDFYRAGTLATRERAPA